MSRSTVSRKIDKLKKHLKRFNIRFTYTEAGMSGDERLIRLAYLIFVAWHSWNRMPSKCRSAQQLTKIVDTYKDYFHYHEPTLVPKKSNCYQH